MGPSFCTGFRFMPTMRSKVAYAKKVATSGFYLECIDGYLACLYFGYDYRIIVNTELEEFKVIAYQDTLHALDAAAVDVPAGPLQRDSKDTLCLACCAANFSQDPSLAQNHYVPVLFKEQVSPDIWFYLSTELPICLRNRIREQRRAAVLKDQCDEEDLSRSCVCYLSLVLDEAMICYDVVFHLYKMYPHQPIRCLVHQILSNNVRPFILYRDLLANYVRPFILYR